MNSIKNVLILGSGTMGLQIGLQCAAYDMNVIIFDVKQKAVETGLLRLRKLADAMVRHQRVTGGRIEQTLGRIQFSMDPQTAGKNADLISESIPEDPDLKSNVFSQFNAICPAHTIFTTNSSTLVPSMIADGSGRPDRFAALHFHSILVTNIVDVMPHPGTSGQTMEKLLKFCKAIDQYPIELKKEQSGYVYNTMLVQMLLSALMLKADETAAVADIDRAWMGIMKTRVGPFGIMDSIGLDTVLGVTEYWAGKEQDPRALAGVRLLKKYVDKGHLGIKSGCGFYRYPDPEFTDAAFMAGIY